MKRNENTRKCLFFYSCTSKEREIVNFFILSTLFQSVVNLLRAFPNSPRLIHSFCRFIFGLFHELSHPKWRWCWVIPERAVFPWRFQTIYFFFLFSCIYSTHIHTLEEKRERKETSIQSRKSIDVVLFYRPIYIAKTII